MQESNTEQGWSPVGDDLLFDDGLPRISSDTGFNVKVAANTVGITYRQLDYWARTDLVVPSIRDAGGSGTQRLYSFRDILVLKLIKRLIDTGISLQQIRVAVKQLHEAGVRDLARTTLMSDGAGIYLCTSNDEVIDLLNRGQGVFGIAVGKVLHEVESSLVDIAEYRDTRQTKTVDEIAAYRARKLSS